MGFFDDMFGKLKTTMFYKDFEESTQNKNNLEKLIANEANITTKKSLEYQLSILKKGDKGESDVARTLKTSYLPIVCLHNIRLELSKDEIAQIDFILITHKFLMVLEVKDLNTSLIKINENGEFIRVQKSNDTSENGMPSPIEQNDTHIRVLKQFLKQNNILKSVPIYSEIIMTNCNSLIDRSNAPIDIKNKIHKVEALPKIISEQLKLQQSSPTISKAKMIKFAELLVEANKPKYMNYAGRFKAQSIVTEPIKTNYAKIKDVKNEAIKNNTNQSLNNNTFKVATNISKTIKKKTDEEIIEALKIYRSDVVKAKNLKPYYVYKDDSIKDIAKKRPKTKEDLLEIQGIGPKTIDNYGDDILKIVNS